MSQIKSRWGITSSREFAGLLHMNTRTVGKLNSRHPDGSLSLLSLDCIYRRLYALVRVRFIECEVDEEYRLLMESRFRIMEAEDELPASIAEEITDELGEMIEQRVKGMSL